VRGTRGYRGDPRPHGPDVTGRCDSRRSAGEALANWLPAPDGPFMLLMRLCNPRAPILTGAWTPSAVDKIASE